MIPFSQVLLRFDLVEVLFEFHLVEVFYFQGISVTKIKFYLQISPAKTTKYYLNQREPRIKKN